MRADRPGWFGLYLGMGIGALAESPDDWLFYALLFACALLNLFPLRHGR